MFFALIYEKQFIQFMKIWIHLLIKKHACFELLNFKIPFINKNVEYSQAERVKNRFQETNFVKKNYKIMFYALFVCGHCFFIMGLSKSAFFYLLFWGTSFLSLFFLCNEFWIRYHIYRITAFIIVIVYVSAIWPSVILFSLKYFYF